MKSNVFYYQLLNDAERTRLENDARTVIAEKTWEGCGGLEITDEMKVTIAAQACLLVLNLELADYYARVSSILVYPSRFLIPSRFEGTEVIFDGGQATSGQAVYRGPVILSWEDVLEEGRDPLLGSNVVFHEFAHQLDMLDGGIDGTPFLRSEKQRKQWQRVMTREFDRLVAASKRGEATLLDKYGTRNEGEFFAVATECFFNWPAQMRRWHPRLYELLRGYYRQDPASRVPAVQP